ncbi:bifunctional phosphopantothenoylcysteine decarboxylase/phosphopantothenate--cysteine ligase CoaBC [Marinobacter salicampi]|uniref:bifunctional phosphopantothenoylcysteine decarboxylase/phosphopantothenate--cysteine ligase CoaBC n=1 Tax=Marinobacter salicampi TaxID=435907 RepID=UPI0014098C3B|nr:bifunctional phosphopantothenoylcysteine decarboxylase/phosphopantothenate--cysteine ligase CoaBC [Marinobacter salicampi]
MAQKRILLGVTGGIAAYKSAELVRLLKKAGHRVQVVLTGGAEAFIAPLTFQALSGEAVRTSLLDPEAEAGMGHIELAKWADLVLVAPASANFIARLAHGFADDLLTTVCCATAAPIALAPAMNQAMWSNARTGRNLELLQVDPQVSIWGPAQGDQACGDTGPGRMLEPQVIADLVTATESTGAGALTGQRVVITAGPTREAIDPVRYISNHSSGKMGYALAAAAKAAGAEVVLISGPVALAPPVGVEVRPVITALELFNAADAAVAETCDIFIATAAVADYRPRNETDQKMKKSGETLSLELVRNPDVLAHVAGHPNAPFTVGFAAETNDLEQYATGKLKKKKLNMIVANDVSQPGIGFNSDDNAITVFWADGRQTFDRSSKAELAQQLIQLVAQRYRQQSGR